MLNAAQKRLHRTATFVKELDSKKVSPKVEPKAEKVEEVKEVTEVEEQKENKKSKKKTEVKVEE